MESTLEKVERLEAVFSSSSDFLVRPQLLPLYFHPDYMREAGLVRSRMPRLTLACRAVSFVGIWLIARAPETGQVLKFNCLLDLCLNSLHFV
jgi:hypothetical protein